MLSLEVENRNSVEEEVEINRENKCMWQCQCGHDKSLNEKRNERGGSGKKWKGMP